MENYTYLFPKIPIIYWYIESVLAMGIELHIFEGRYEKTKIFY